MPSILRWGVEHYAFNEGVSEGLGAGRAGADVLNTSWREYGLRVAAWRVLEAFKQYQLPLSILLNTAVYDYAPELLAACRKAGHEIVAHGHSNSDIMSGMSDVEQATYIRRVTERIAQVEGKRPTGWASPWIAETLTTPDILQEAGYSYLCDWVAWTTSRSG